LFRQQADYAIFSIPFGQMLITVAIVFGVCTIVPILAYRSSCCACIVERLQEAE
jgi:putative ABC transport system permease protein